VEEAALPRSGEAVLDLPPLTLLVVDDDATGRAILRALLEKDGHRVIEAEDGAGAVAAFSEHQPDMVLMDVMMPEMDGYQATALIKSMSGERFVPVLFVTAALDEESLALCVACGGDDFIAKPLNRFLLRAKLAAMERMRRLYRELTEQRDALLSHHQRLQTEHEVAERVFSKILHANPLDIENLRVHLAPMEITNGDVVFSARRPLGEGRHLLLGDFTGHGLSAALGAMPVSDVFYAMTERGFSLRSITLEINKKLREKLPTGLFMACALVHHDPAAGRLEVFNCGLPDVLVIDRRGALKARIPSANLPLGVVDSDELTLRAETIDVAPGDRVLLYSDGLIEAVDENGAMFGEARLLAEIEAGHPPHRLFERIRAAVDAFRGEARQSDDITLVEMLCLGVTGVERAAHPADPRPQATPRTDSAEQRVWCMALELGPEALAEFDLNQFMSQAMTCMPRLEAHATHLFTILAELYSNALEHGVLGLDSILKEDPLGFARYYEERARRLKALREGRIRLELSLLSREGREAVQILVEDSGPGFDYRAWLGREARQTVACGRGLTLLRSLCADVRWLGEGNRVVATYRPV